MQKSNPDGDISEKLILEMLGPLSRGYLDAFLFLQQNSLDDITLRHRSLNYRTKCRFLIMSGREVKLDLGGFNLFFSEISST